MEARPDLYVTTGCCQWLAANDLVEGIIELQCFSRNAAIKWGFFCWNGERVNSAGRKPVWVRRADKTKGQRTQQDGRIKEASAAAMLSIPTATSWDCPSDLSISLSGSHSQIISLSAPLALLGALEFPLAARVKEQVRVRTPAAGKAQELTEQK